MSHAPRLSPAARIATSRARIQVARGSGCVGVGKEYTPPKSGGAF
jgi:hypothetical protein